MSKLIKLSPLGFASKWGFDDGDQAYPPLLKWVESSYYADKFKNEDPALRYFIHSHTLLAEMIERKIVPLLPNSLQASLTFSQSVHNPITLDLEDTNIQAQEELDNLLASLPKVTFNQKEINQYCTNLFPLRSNGYLKLNAKILSSHIPYQSNELFAWGENYCEKIIHPSLLVKKLLDKFLNTYSDQEFEIASILYDDQETPESFQSLFELAAKV